MDQNVVEEKHRNVCGPRLTKTPAPDESWQSTTHAAYTPKNNPPEREGRRKLLLERVVLQETAEEEAREMMKPNPVEEYDTEYHGSFDIPNFVPSIDNFPKDSELHKKYPLHNGVSISYNQENMEHMVGATRSVDPLQPFKKNSAFTKPLDEILDEPVTPL